MLGVAPYFDQPYYVGFTVGGFELGLIPDGTPGPDGVHAYWGVSDAAAAFARLQAAGATVREAPHDVGEGIKVASVATRSATRSRSSRTRISRRPRATVR